ncbi:MAG: glycosyltransferase [Aeromicrobium sp.]
MVTPDIDRIAVIVPANNEEALLVDAIDALETAAEQVDLDVELIVVANGCTDRTAEIAADRGGVQVLVDAVPNVGAARALGAAWALRDGPDGLWLASTDADSRVPLTWMSEQARCAAFGFDLFLGTVCLPDEDVARHHRWVGRYRAKRAHVHGANLGVRATTYRDIGGFRPLPAHEDADLVSRLRRAGALTWWVNDVPVTTSARPDPRAPAGVGADLAHELLA